MIDPANSTLNRGQAETHSIPLLAPFAVLTLSNFVVIELPSVHCPLQ
jgi:hypothetical protein